MAAKAGVEPTTLRLKVIVSTKAPPRPIYIVDRQNENEYTLVCAYIDAMAVSTCI